MRIASVLLVLAAIGARGACAGEISVSCAACLQDAVRSIARIYETRHAGTAILVNTGSSSLLARQIEEGAPVDLFISADERTLRRLESAGLIDPTSVTFLAANRIVAIAPSDRVLEIRGPNDLVSPEVRRIALADTLTPIGNYAHAYLEGAGLLERLEGRIVHSENVRAILGAVASGSADLGLVYATDAATTDRVRIVWEVPPDSIPPVRVVAGIVRGCRHGAAARAFLDLLLSAPGDSVLDAAGFLRIEDAGR